MNNKIIIGTRGSNLSLAYANKVKDLISLTKQLDNHEISIKTIKTSGDIYAEKKISEIGGKNLFCKEIEKQLLEKKIDIAVHSLKDMDSSEEKKLIIQAYIKRNDPRDVLVLNDKKNFDGLDNFTIGSSSRRRELQLKILNKNINIKNIRGNIDTRIKKIMQGEYDGAVLALAGIKTLKLEKYVNKIFEVDKLLPAAGQGIIAAQCRNSDEDIKKILEKINDEDTKICALAERSLLKSVGGDCDTALGTLATLENDDIKIKAQLFSDDGKKNYIINKTGKKNNPEILGKIAGEELLKISGENYKKK